MREILFRGVCQRTNKFVYGYLSNKDVINTDKGRLKVKPKTIGQFTGLTDKNRAKIFEGDIVRWDDETNGDKWRVAVVEFNPDIQFRIIRIECNFIQSAKEGYIFKFGRFAYKDTNNHLEIIGNIYN